MTPSPRSIRPGFLSLTIAAALLVTPGFALVASHFDDEGAYHRARDAAFDNALRDALLKRGFAPWSATDPQTPARANGVEFIAASGPFALDLGGGRLTGRAPATARATTAVRLVSRELARYPRPFIDAIRLRRVILCEGLHEADRAIPSLPNYEHSLFLDVDARPAFLVRIVHHEVFHFADLADDGVLGRDPAWTRLNDHWFVYGNGGRFMRDPGSAKLTRDLPGFLSRYAQSALEEDKAETFSFAMTAPGEVAAIARHDAIVRSKLALLRREVARFAPSMRGAF